MIAAVIVVGQSPPRVLTNPDPVYPPEAAQLGYGGTVKVSIKVNKAGKVKVLQAWGPAAPCSGDNDSEIKKIRMAVIDAAESVVFESPMKNGKPTEIEMTISYMFNSAGKPASSRENSGGAGPIVDAGVLMGRVKHMERPDYPASARANRLSGSVPVSVVVDVDGKVIAASALGGHKILQGPAVDAACKSSIEPVQLSGRPIQVSGVITFNFLA